MNTSSKDGVSNSSPSREDRFDAAMRALHQAAAANVSTQVRWKLRPAAQRSRADRTDRFGRWRVGTAFAGLATAVFALALGVSLWKPTEDTIPATGALAAASVDDGATVLEQDPDFYAWLASDDADLLAME